MAIINVDDAYILNETGAQVDKVTGLFTKNENATTGEKQMARLNIAAGGSNDNLLENAYFVGGGSQLGYGIFPINQRGQTSYGGIGTHIDRWFCNDLVGGLSLSASGMSITVGTQFYGYQQCLPMSRLEEGETYTFSIKISGQIYSWTFTLSSAGQSQYAGWFGNNDVYSYIGVLNGMWRIMPFDSATGTLTTVSGVQAMKLEKGSISTLANDAPPKFRAELANCQQYLWQKTFPANTQIGVGSCIDANTVVVDVVVPVAMRPNVTATFTANVLFLGEGTLAVATAVTGIGAYDNNVRMIISSAGLTAYKLYSLFTSTETTMTISAEPQ